MKQKYLAPILAILVIAGGAYWYVNNNPATAPEAAEQQDPNVPPSEGAENTIEVNDNSNTAGNVPSADTIIVTQQSAGTYVTVDNVNLSKPGFVVIHSDNNGKLGPAVGYSGYLTAGSKQDLEVKAAIVTGSKYWAEIHWDNGDKLLNATVDLPATSEKSRIQFTVSQ